MSNKARDVPFDRKDFDILRNMSNEHSGIVVSDDKFDMFYSRLSKHVRRLGLQDFSEYCKLLKQDNGTEFSEFINSITTNLTSFFREQHHFDYLGTTVIPQLLKANASTQKIRVWSAGCSTGEEPYSLAMAFLENCPRSWDVKILATDLDTNVLSTASKGVYSRDRVDGINDSRLRRWFRSGKGAQAGNVCIKDDLGSIISFGQLNLMGPWPMRGLFDVIFCRNVLIYFDAKTKSRLISGFSRYLGDPAWLFIGHSESLHQISDQFSLCGNTIYRKECSDAAVEANLGIA